LFAALLLAAATTAAQKPWTDAPATYARPTGVPTSIVQLSKQAMPAVVGIVAVGPRGESRDPFHDFLDRVYGSGAEREQPVRGIGTGFFIRADGLIATNGHVVEGATDITVQVGEDERAYRGTLVGKDDATDLALIRIQGSGPFPVLTLGDSEGLEVGEWVVAIGNPFGLSRSVTTGIVSFKGRRDVNPTGRPGYYDFIQTDAAINPGNSGGPLLDARGAVVGINAAVNPSGQGIGFAIPVNMLKEVAPQLEKGRVVRSWMGVSVQDQLGPELAESFAVPGGKGVLITEVAQGGPAYKAGVKPGDVVISFDDVRIAEAYRLRWLSATAGPGRVIRLGIWRDAHLYSASVVMREKPDAEGEERTLRLASTSAPRGTPQPFGLAVEDRTDESGAGVKVTAVELGSSAYRAGLREGDVVVEVDGRPVRDRAGFRKSLESHANVTRLLVRRGNRSIFFGLRNEPVRPGQPAIPGAP
jgi:Do/DeqQ family serine protease